MVPHKIPLPNDLTVQDWLQQILNRLLRVLDAERNRLLSGSEGSFEHFAREKLQIFADLDRYIRSNTTVEFSSDNQSLLDKVRVQMKENMCNLEFRMRAFGEIAKTIEEAVEDSESDGTYSADDFWPRAV